MEYLTFEDCASSLFKWAWHFQSKRFELWELINAAWLDSGVRSLPKSKIKLASGRIRYGMIDYMRKETQYRRRKTADAKGKLFAKIRNFSDLQKVEGRNLLDVLRNRRAEVVDIERKEFVNYVIDNSNLIRKEKLAMKLYYIAGFTQKEVGKVIGITESRVSQMIKRAINMIKSSKAISNYEMEE